MGARSKVQEGAAYKVQEGVLYKVQSPFFREIFQEGVAYKVQSDNFFNFFFKFFKSSIHIFHKLSYYHFLFFITLSDPIESGGTSLLTLIIDILIRGRHKKNFGRNQELTFWVPTRNPLDPKYYRLL